MQRLRLTFATAAVLAALAAPAPASAAQSNYVVTLRPPVDTTCERAIIDVTMSHDLVPTAVFTASTCGFSDQLSTSAVRALTADPRVASVVEDTRFKSATP